MKAFKTCFFAAWIAGFVTCGSLAADTVTLPDLPDGDVDTISIQLDPVDGAVNGLPGASVGWGFTVDWTSKDGDWVSFTSSSPGYETNPGLLAAGGYTDFIGLQGGPDSGLLSPASSPWTEAFNGASQGVGSYRITNDLNIAVPGAEDTGQITFNFQVYDSSLSNQLGDSSYAYYAPTTTFSVTVDSSSSNT